MRAPAEQRRLTLEAGDMGTWDYRVQTGEVFCDARCRNQWGISHGDPMDYATVIAAIHPDDRAATDEAVRRALAGADGGAHRCEFRVVWPDGSVHWISTHGQVIFGSEGKRRFPVRCIGTSRDITERKSMDSALEFLLRCGDRDADAYFYQALARFLSQTLDMDFVRIDQLWGDGLSSRTMAMYPMGAFEDNVPYALNDTAAGETLSRFVCCVPRDVRHRFPKDGLLQALKGESYVGVAIGSSGEKPIGLIAVIGRKPLANPHFAESMLKLAAVRAVGELQRAHAEKALQQAHGELEVRILRRVIELGQEIEIRRQAEQQLIEAELRYRTVAEFTHDWEYWETPEYVLRYCSPSCQRITGYSAQEFIANPRLLQQIVYPEDAGIWREYRETSLSAPEPRVVQFRIRKKDGSVRWLEHAWQPVLGKDGVFMGIRASNRDITDRKEEELKTQRLREQLAHVSRVTTAGQLAASLAHELNQPLTAILCNAKAAERLLEFNPPYLKEVQEALGDIRSDTQRAGGVIKRLRALFNKTGQERTLLHFEELLQETLGLLRSEFVLRGVSPQVEVEPNLPGIMGNRIELQQVALNLAVNALEAMMDSSPASRRLHISTCRQDLGMMRASFRDLGPGIPEAHLSRLFEPFFTTKPDGMGMGLAICQTIIEAHGGRLWAVNNPERGATFHFTLPIHNQLNT